MIILIDALSVLYRAYYAIPELTIEDGEQINAIFGLLNTYLSLLSKFNPEHILVCFDSPKPNLRSQTISHYKGNRKEAEEEFIAQIEIAKTVTKLFGFGYLENSGHEADDIIGSLSHQLKEEVIIVSSDSDLLQLIEKNRVQVLLVRSKSRVLFNEKEVFKHFNLLPNQLIDYKALAGDASDNIPGVKGIGEKTATRLLIRYKSLDEIYKKISSPDFIKNGFTKRIQSLLVENKASAYEAKDLVTIYRDIEVLNQYNFKLGWKDCIDLIALNEILDKYKLSYHKIKINSFFDTGDDKHKKQKKKKTSQKTLKATSIALWIIDSDCTDADEEQVLNYTKLDDIELAYSELSKQINDIGASHLFEMEKALTSVLQKMEARGILIDKKYMQKLSKKYNKELTTLQKEIYKLAGCKFNINSPKQLGEIIFDKLKLKKAKANKSTKESVLLEIKDDHKIIPFVLKYRHVKKLISTYIDNFLELLDKTNRIHTTYIQNGTTTGRITSKNPNLQNIPSGNSGSEVRKCFIAEKGYIFYSYDYSQIELKIAAVLSKDKILLDRLNNSIDIHSGVAASVFNIDEKHVTLDQRRHAKAINFGILYGMGSQALSKSLGTTPAQAKEYLEKYKKTFWQLDKYLTNLKLEATATGFVKTAFNRLRKVNGINSSIGFIRAQAERVAMNSPIQGTAADIIKFAMVEIDKYLIQNNLENDVRMLLQLHDELLFEVRDGVDSKILQDIVNIMENIPIKNDVKMKLTVSNECGNNWGELK